MPVLINLWSDGESDAEEERSNPANDDADDEAARAIDGLMHESTLHADGTQPAAIASTTAPVEPAVEPAAPQAAAVHGERFAQLLGRLARPAPPWGEATVIGSPRAERGGANGRSASG